MHEAQYRALALALHTYRFKAGGVFVKMFTKGQLQDQAKQISYEEQVLRAFSKSAALPAPDTGPIPHPSKGTRPHQCTHIRPHSLYPRAFASSKFHARSPEIILKGLAFSLSVVGVLRQVRKR